MARNRIQRNRLESHLSPKLKGISIPNDILNPTAATTHANQDTDELIDSNISQELGTGPIILQLLYTFSGGSSAHVGGLRATVDGESSTIPHIVIETTGRIFAMLERKAVDPSGIKFLCVHDIQRLPCPD